MTFVFECGSSIDHGILNFIFFNICQKEIENYLIKREAQELMNTCKQNRNISARNRRNLLNLIVDLLVEKSGNLYPNICSKTAIAKATVTLFPKFRDENSNDEIVS